MKRYGIVVGIDGSAASDAAVLWAAREAAMRNEPLALVHMLKDVRADVSADTDAGRSRGMAGRRRPKVLEQAVKIAEDAAPKDRKISITSEVKGSPPVPTLVEMSEEAEMIVVGSNGRGAVGRVLLGSVSSGVVHGAKCPVAVIRAEASHTPPSDRAPVLVGIDCSPASELALAIAFEEASFRGVELTALHAWSDVAVYQLPWVDWPEEAERNSGRVSGGLARALPRCQGEPAPRS